MDEGESSCPAGSITHLEVRVITNGIASAGFESAAGPGSGVDACWTWASFRSAQDVDFFRHHLLSARASGFKGRLRLHLDRIFLTLDWVGRALALSSLQPAGWIEQLLSLSPEHPALIIL